MKVLVLTGAGISAESGIPTFRGAGGLWEGHRIEEVATWDAFCRNPSLVYRFYNERRENLLSESIRPNAAHIALAEFERKHRGEFLLVTQNIDNLHVRAGSKSVLAMHGELLKARCMETGELYEWTEPLDEISVAPGDHLRRGTLRPHVVWFGEEPIGMGRIAKAAEEADLFIAIGTSAVVYPAASIGQWTRPRCRRIEVNLDDTPASPIFDETIRGKAGEVLPSLLERIYKESYSEA